MKFILMISGFLLTVSGSVCVDFTVRGTEGDQVTIKCPYAEGYENSYKYFYKGHYRYNNLILKSAGGKSPVSDGRFSLRDDHQTRSFTVTIRNLTMADAGLYCCGAGWGEYKLTQLNVIKAPQKTRPVQISTSTLHPYTNTSTDHTSTGTPQTESETTRTMTGNSADQPDQPNNRTPQTESERTRTMTGNSAVQPDQPNISLASVAGGLGSVLLVLVLCSGTFLILKKRKRKSGTALFQRNVQHNTEEIPNSDVIAATPSSNQTPASHLNTCPQVSTVYATVTKQKPDSNPSRTHSTNQVTDTDYDYYTNMNPPEPTTDSRRELIYSTVTRPQNIKTNDGPIYSIIKHK